MYKLVVTEKNSVAKSISTVLNANERKGGFFIGGGYIVSWCAGHLLELAAPDAYGDYAKWRFADLPIIPDKWKYNAIKGKAEQLKILKDLMKRSDVECVINACDAGREGENIFRLVYNHTKCTKKIYRLWISSLEDAAIKAGFANLKDGKEYDSLYAAASSREHADWLIGINATRAFSCLYRGSTLNVGRVHRRGTGRC
jgi:DNA topoisomerase-3